MSHALDDPAGFLNGVQRAVRKRSGKALTPMLKRWRNTRSAEDLPLELQPATARFLLRYGVLDAAMDQPSRQNAFAVLATRMARATGEAPGVIASWLNAFAGTEYGLPDSGPCVAEPQCTNCPVCAHCRFIVSGAKAVQISGAAFERGLVSSKSKGAAPEAAELLALILSGGTGGAAALGRAEAVLRKFGGLRELFSAPDESLRRHGLDDAALARLRVVSGLCRLWSAETQTRGRAFTCGRDFFEHYHLRLRDKKKESFFVICLDQKNCLVNEAQVSEGTLTETIVHPREVFRPAIEALAAAVAVVHNHPSGDPTPSKADKEMTKRLKEAATLLGIRFLDHVVVGDGSFTSFHEKGLL